MLEFLSLKEEAFGLDISDFSFKIFKFGRKKRNDFRVASWGSFVWEDENVIRDGRIQKPDVVSERIKKSFSKVKGNPLKTKKVVVSLPEEMAFMQVIQMPRMEKEDLKKAVMFEAENYIPMSKEKVYLDFKVVKPVVDSLDHKDILISAFPKNVADSYFSVLKNAGLQPMAFELEPQSISRSVIKDGLFPGRILIMDIGKSRTKFIIFAGRDVRFISSIGLAGNIFTQSIVKHFDVSQKEAEKIKRKKGLSRKMKIKIDSGREQEEGAVFEALIPSVTDLMEQIKKTIDYYSTHASHEHLPVGKNKIEKILLCGGGSRLKGLDRFLEEELEIKVEQADPLINISGGDKEKQIDGKTEFATAVGLALRGVNWKIEK